MTGVKCQVGKILWMRAMHETAFSLFKLRLPENRHWWKERPLWGSNYSCMQKMPVEMAAILCRIWVVLRVRTLVPQISIWWGCKHWNIEKSGLALLRRQLFWNGGTKGFWSDFRGSINYRAPNTWLLRLRWTAMNSLTSSWGVLQQIYHSYNPVNSHQDSVTCSWRETSEKELRRCNHDQTGIHNQYQIHRVPYEVENK